MISALGNYVSIGRNALAVILLLGFAFFLKGTLSKQPLALPSMATAAASEFVLAAAQPARAKVLQRKEPDMPISEAQELAKQSPEEIASVVRNWLAEDKRAA